MPDRVTFPASLAVRRALPGYRPASLAVAPRPETGPAGITRAASQQTYYTIRFLVDRDRVANAFRAYAYFRWLDDWLDGPAPDRRERVSFLERQQEILDRCYRGTPPRNLTAEETILAALIASDASRDSGLHCYLSNMMAVMMFDANRRGYVVSRHELDEYSRCLATAVTEALHYFIGHGRPAPTGPQRYHAATAAHISHMLRDTAEDVAAGYFNIPCEFLQAYRIEPYDLDSDGYRVWVKSRVRLARAHFAAGRAYLVQVASWRCRVAGYAYIARFLGVLDTIEQDDYRLRADYSDQMRLRAGLRRGWEALFWPLTEGRLPRPGSSSR